MRYGLIAAVAAAIAVLTAPLTIPSGSRAFAEDAPKDVKGIFLMSDYPAVTLRPGETSTISLRLQNYNMTPERLALTLSGVPAGWTATLLGGGQPVAAAISSSPGSARPFGMVQAPASFFAQNGPPGWASRTSSSGLRRNARIPALICVRRGMELGSC